MSTHKCIYCNQPANYQFKNGKWCCSKNMNGCPEIKRIRKEKSKENWQKLKENNIYSLSDSKASEILNSKENIDIGIPHICFYCGKEANYQLKNKRWCCKPKSCQCMAIREKK